MFSSILLPLLSHFSSPGKKYDEKESIHEGIHRNILTTAKKLMSEEKKRKEGNRNKRKTPRGEHKNKPIKLETFPWGIILKKKNMLETIRGNPEGIAEKSENNPEQMTSNQWKGKEIRAIPHSMVTSWVQKSIIDQTAPDMIFCCY